MKVKMNNYPPNSGKEALELEESGWGYCEKHCFKFRTEAYPKCPLCLTEKEEKTEVVKKEKRKKK